MKTSIFFRQRPASSGAARSAFTRTDLLAACCASLFLGTIALTGIAAAARVDGRLACLSNQRLMMTAVNLFATDNNEQLPYPSWGRPSAFGVDSWAYGERNLGRLPGALDSMPDLRGAADRSPQLPFRRIGQLWPYLKNGSVYDCPDDLSKQDPNAPAYIDRSMKATSYTISAVIISFTSGGVRHPASALRPDAILLWEPHEEYAHAFNDASNNPNLSEGLGNRHGSQAAGFRGTLSLAETRGGGNVGRLDGGAHYMSREKWAELSNEQFANQLWCNPLTVSGRRLDP